MILTIFGILVAAIGALMLLFKRPLREFLAVLLVCSVLGSAEAVALPMLGGASLAVPYFFVFFVILRMFLMAYKNFRLFQEAFLANIWLVLFAFYGVIAAMIFPRMFEGAISIISMRPLLYRVPLTFTPQNITQATYICLSALTAIAAYAAARMPKSDQALSLGWFVASMAFLLFAALDLIGFYGGAGNLMDWARTASYAMVAQAEMGIKRISGSFAEPSSFATFGAAPLLYFSLCWLLDVKGVRAAGLLAMGLAAALALSTSTTAFAMLGILFLVLVGGIVVLPMAKRVRKRKFVQFLSAIVACVFGAVILAILLPQFANSFVTLAEKMTVDKAASGSAVERGQWAAQGFTAFAVSNGLGVGPGSFRSSGLFQSVIGSLGVLGSFFLAMHLLLLVRNLMRRKSFSQDKMVGVATVTALLMLTPQAAAAAGPDPGILFSVMSGIALGRYRTAKIRAAIEAEEAHTELAAPPGLSARPA